MLLRLFLPGARTIWKLYGMIRQYVWHWNDVAFSCPILPDCRVTIYLFTPITDNFFIHSFLNDLDRIASWEYSVTDDDIVRARLKTVGIQEHRLVFKDGPWNNRLCTLFYFFITPILSYIYHTLADDRHDGWEWRIYDVGGCRTLVGINRILKDDSSSS